MLQILLLSLLPPGWCNGLVHNKSMTLCLAYHTRMLLNRQHRPQSNILAIIPAICYTPKTLLPTLSVDNFMTTHRQILHMDLNAFFASVEQQANPALRGKPIAVVGGHGRTVITTSSYETRAKRVKTGMAIWEGKRTCPELIIVVGDNKKYTYTSSKIMEMMNEYTPEIEAFSIDEAWLDVTHSLSIFGSAERIAYLIKARIFHTFGLKCSIGIAPNKLLAKLASELKKPDGLTVIKPGEVSRLLESMPIQELCGVGRRMQKAINKMSIYTCGELGRCDVDRLNGIYGFSGDNGAATSASLYSPSGVTFDSIGNLYITDYFNQRIRKVYMNRVPTVTALQSSAIGNSSVSGSAVAFTATVTSTENIPTTTITFKDGGATIGSGMLDATGTATFTTSSLAQI